MFIYTTRITLTWFYWNNTFNDNHTHYMIEKTTFNDGHVHQYNIQTDPSIPTGNGHIHYYKAATSYKDGHIYYMNGYTEMSKQ